MRTWPAPWDALADWNPSSWKAVCLAALRPSGEGWNCNVLSVGLGACERTKSVCNPAECVRQETAFCFTDDYKGASFECVATEKLCGQMQRIKKAEINGYNSGAGTSFSISDCGEWR
jgi:hypothetical protein